METAKRQSAARQPAIDLLQSEGQDRARSSARTFKMRDALPKLCDGGTGGAGGTS